MFFVVKRENSENQRQGIKERKNKKGKKETITIEMTTVQLPRENQMQHLEAGIRFSAAITNDHKLGGLKQYPFIISVSVGQKFQRARLGSWLRVS